jgi:putative ABC transport system substrate-binding protein
VRRRELITLVGATVITWPRAVEAQQPTLPVIGFLNSASADAFRKFVESFRRGQCPLSGVKRTWDGCASMSAFDPKRTSGLPIV